MKVMSYWQQSDVLREGIGQRIAVMMVLIVVIIIRAPDAPIRPPLGSHKNESGPISSSAQWWVQSQSIEVEEH